MTTRNKAICVIGAPMNLGCGRSGPKFGPAYLRRIIQERALFARRRFIDCGDIDIPAASQPPVSISDIPYLSEIREASNDLQAQITACLREPNVVPLILGGDHAVSWGSIAATIVRHPDAVVVYLDAHGDFNTTATSPSNHMHGMHMAYLMGADRKALWKPGHDILDPNRAFFLGTRSLDPGEKQLAEKLNLNIRTAEDIHTQGMERTLSDLHCFLQEHNSPPIHLSIDVDVLDPEIAPGTGVPEVDGLSIDAVMKLLAGILQTGSVAVIDLVEYNPRLDREELTKNACGAILTTIDTFLP